MRPTNRPSRIGFLTAIGGLALVLAACSSTGASTAPSAAAPSVAPLSRPGECRSIDRGRRWRARARQGDRCRRRVPDRRRRPDALHLHRGLGRHVHLCRRLRDRVAARDRHRRSPAVPAGVSGALTTFARPDGSMQLALNGMPLYYYAKDTKAGDTTGEGVGGEWFVARPDGRCRRPTIVRDRLLISHRASARRDSRGHSRVSRPGLTVRRHAACPTGPCRPHS